MNETLPNRWAGVVQSRRILLSITAVVWLGLTAPVAAQGQDDFCTAFPDDPTCDPTFDAFDSDPAPFDEGPTFDEYCVAFPNDPSCDPDFDPLAADGFAVEVDVDDVPTFDEYCETFPGDPVCDPDFDPATDDYCVEFADDPICAGSADAATELSGTVDPLGACVADPFQSGCPLDPCLYDACGTEAANDRPSPQVNDAPGPGGNDDGFVETVAARYATQSDLELVVSLQNHLLAEIDLLTGLGAFAPVPPQFQAIADHTDPMPRFALLRRLPLVETAGTVLLEELDRREFDTSPAVRTTLAELDAAQRFALQDGDEGVLQPADHLNALSDAIYREGRVSTTGDADLPLAEVEALLATLDGDEATAPSAEDPRPVGPSAPVPRTEETPATDVAEPETDAPAELALVDPAGDASATLPIVLGAATVAGLSAVAVGLRRRKQPAETGQDAPSVAALLEASRRLAHTLDETEVAEIAVDEAIDLVDAEVGAFVGASPEGLQIRHETPDGLLAPEGLDRSILARVAETGQPVHAVTTSDTAVTDVPLALAAVPVVCNGSITGVLVVGRSSTEAFEASDIERLEMLAPMVGSALSAAMDHRSVAELVSTDGLTGLRNRRALDTDLAQANAENAAACFVMIDVDHFKVYNDTNGHAAGDTALKQVAAILTATVREMDRVYRYGGEEFSVIIPGANLRIAHDVAERIRAAIEAAPFDGEEHQPNGKVTASLGLACARPTEPVASIIERADAALYRAKDGGRNQVEVAG